MITCAECADEFEPRRSDQAFCSVACNKANTNRAQARARRLYNAAYHFRLEHDRFGPNWKFMMREIGSWIREDREAGRPPPPAHNHDANRGHERGKKL